MLTPIQERVAGIVGPLGCLTSARQPVTGRGRQIVSRSAAIVVDRVVRNAFGHGAARDSYSTGRGGSLALTTGFLEGVQLRKRLAVLGSIGALLGCDDVVQSRCSDCEAFTLDQVLPQAELFVRNQTSVGIGQARQDVEPSRVGHPRGDIG